MKRLLVTAALAMSLTAATAQATEVKVGIDRASNCNAFGCPDSQALVTQQQLYTASSFIVPTSIGSVSFYKAASAPIDATLASMTFNLSFFLTDKTLTTLSSNLASNRGALLADFGNFTLAGGLQPDVLTFGSPAAFTYNPSAGNLLMQISILGDTIDGSAQFRTDSQNLGTDPAPTIRRAIGTDFDGFIFNFTAQGAMVTNFSSVTVEAPTAVVPEPATWALMLVGFGLVGGAMRRRRTTQLTYA